MLKVPLNLDVVTVASVFWDTLQWQNKN